MPIVFAPTLGDNTSEYITKGTLSIELRFADQQALR